MRLSQCALFLAWTSFLSATFEVTTAQREQGLCQDETNQGGKNDNTAKDTLLAVQAWFDTTKRYAVIRVTVCGNAATEPFCFVSSITGVAQDNFIDDEVLRKNLLSTFQGDGKIEPIDQFTQHGQLNKREKKRQMLSKLRENISSGSHVIYKLCKKAQVYLFIANKDTEAATVKPTRKRRERKVRTEKPTGTKGNDGSLKDFISKCFRQRNESCSRICVGQNTLSGNGAMKCRKFRIQCLFQCRMPLDNLKGPNTPVPSATPKQRE